MSPEIEYINFINKRPSATGRTLLVDVQSVRQRTILGEIKWLGRWRQYVFHPADWTAFNPDCLRVIADQCEQMTKDHRPKS